LYYTMDSLISHETSLAMQYLSLTLQTAVGISAGFVFVTAFQHAVDHMRHRHKM